MTGNFGFFSTVSLFNSTLFAIDICHLNVSLMKMLKKCIITDEEKSKSHRNVRFEIFLPPIVL